MLWGFDVGDVYGGGQRPEDGGAHGDGIDGSGNWNWVKKLYKLYMVLTDFVGISNTRSIC